MSPQVRSPCGREFGGRGTLTLLPAQPSPSNSFTKQEPQGRKGEGEAAGAQDVGRKGGGIIGRERGARDCRREALNGRSPGYPEP